MARFSDHSARDKISKGIPSLHHEHKSYSWWVLLSVMIGTFHGGSGCNHC